MDSKKILPETEQPSSSSSVLMEQDTALAPVIIEELDENAITTMDVDMGEFIEAVALKVHEIKDEVPATRVSSPDDLGEQDMLPTDEEDRLTKQFLNGELTFSEYSIRMDSNIDPDAAETETCRKIFDSEFAATATATAKKIDTRKAQKPSSAPQTRQRIRRRRTLPPALQGLMGEANLRFARGEIELAAQICMEIIRQVPSAAEPFQTLAMIYENDQPEKSLQFALIAAHLSPRDADQWIRLANVSLESGNVKQAVTCYSKAIQANPKDEDLYRARAKLQEQIGDKRAFLKGYTRLLHHLEPVDGESVLKYAKFLAKRYMQENSNEQALEAMEHIFLKCPQLVTLEEVNVVTELLIALKQFHKCLAILARYTSIRVDYGKAGDSEEDLQGKTTVGGENREEGNSETEVQVEREIVSCEVPNDVVVDLKAKFLVCLVELDKIEIADELLPKLYLEEDPEVSGDLFLDVAEALMNKNKFQRALTLLEPLVKSVNFSLAAVWLRHAECWVGCKDLRKAMHSYEIVRELSPQHLEARLELAKLYKLKGQLDKAIDVLRQDPEIDILDPGVIYRRTLLLLKVKRYDEFFQSGLLLFSRHCVPLRSRSELTALTRANGVRQRLDALQLYRLSLGETLDDENAPTFSKQNEPSVGDEFLLLLRMCRLACKQKRYGLLQRICFTALTSKRFEGKNAHVMFLCLVACVHNNDSYYGYNVVRELVRVCRRSNAWNLLNVVIQRAEDCRHNRFIMRLLGREDAFSYQHILHANNCLVSGTYKYALNDYVSLFKVGPSALLALLIAVTLVQMACQKFSAKKNLLVIQALAFLKKYSELRGRGGEQEANYNTARAFHQLGLLSAAVHYYGLVLEAPVPDLVKEHSDLLDLKREAAFNLHLIYQQTESENIARMYLEKYITV